MAQTSTKRCLERLKNIFKLRTFKENFQFQLNDRRKGREDYRSATSFLLCHAQISSCILTWTGVQLGKAHLPDELKSTIQKGEGLRWHFPPFFETSLFPLGLPYSSSLP